VRVANVSLSHSIANLATLRCWFVSSANVPQLVLDEIDAIWYWRKTMVMDEDG